MTTPRKIKTTALVATLVTTLISSATIWAQMTPQQYQQHQNDIGMYYQQQDSQKQQQNANAAARRRAWEAREAEVQARIAKHRATPYWMVLAWNFDKNTIAWPGGYSSEQRAIERAKEICSSSNCHILATFNNTCAHFVSAVDKPRSVEDFFVAYDKDGEKAVKKAIQACEAVHGKREDRCFSSLLKTKYGEGVFCVGYDYSLYNQK